MSDTYHLWRRRPTGHWYKIASAESIDGFAPGEGGRGTTVTVNDERPNPKEIFRTVRFWAMLISSYQEAIRRLENVPLMYDGLRPRKIETALRRCRQMLRKYLKEYVPHFKLLTGKPMPKAVYKEEHVVRVMRLV
jgi:hypothetical protein